MTNTDFLKLFKCSATILSFTLLNQTCFETCLISFRNGLDRLNTSADECIRRPWEKQTQFHELPKVTLDKLSTYIGRRSIFISLKSQLFPLSYFFKFTRVRLITVFQYCYSQLSKEVIPNLKFKKQEWTTKKNCGESKYRHWFFYCSLFFSRISSSKLKRTIYFRVCKDFLNSIFEFVNMICSLLS